MRSPAGNIILQARETGRFNHLDRQRGFVQRGFFSTPGAWCVGVFLIVFLCCFPSVGRTQPAAGSAAELLEIYDRSEIETSKRVELVLSATEDGLKAANTYLVTMRKEKPLFCQPSELRMTGRQLLTTLRRAVETDRSLSPKPMGLVLLVSLQNIFPCPATR